ncbi:hypothetical protein RJT34_15551 [Clitoria ternatea]|uniref:Uncharacterized protein n=1 Tax=Clitoria ternatea TaxID=43366 RepID=A0AAN9PCV6_CLITE
MKVNSLQASALPRSHQSRNHLHESVFSHSTTTMAIGSIWSFGLSSLGNRKLERPRSWLTRGVHEESGEVAVTIGKYGARYEENQVRVEIETLFDGVDFSDPLT